MYKSLYLILLSDSLTHLYPVFLLPSALEYVWSGGARPRGRPKRIGTEVMQKDCIAHKLNRVMLWIIID